MSKLLKKEIKANIWPHPPRHWYAGNQGYHEPGLQRGYIVPSERFEELLRIEAKAKHDKQVKRKRVKEAAKWIA